MLLIDEVALAHVEELLAKVELTELLVEDAKSVLLLVAEVLLEEAELAVLLDEETVSVLLLEDVELIVLLDDFDDSVLLLDDDKPFDEVELPLALGNEEVAVELKEDDPVLLTEISELLGKEIVSVVLNKEELFVLVLDADENDAPLLVEDELVVLLLQMGVLLMEEVLRIDDVVPTMLSTLR